MSKIKALQVRLNFILLLSFLGYLQLIIPRMKVLGKSCEVSTQTSQVFS